MIGSAEVPFAAMPPWMKRNVPGWNLMTVPGSIVRLAALVTVTSPVISMVESQGRIGRNGSRYRTQRIRRSVV